MSSLTQNEWKSNVSERIRARRAEAIELLSALVRINSVNPNYPGRDTSKFLGGETRANELFSKHFDDAGLEIHWVDPDPNRKALVGVRRGIGGGQSLMFNGHIDTVPVSETGSWINGDPWDPLIRDGWMYGLGACDMKGGLVAAWLAIRAISEMKVPLLGDLQLHSVPGEESGEHEIGTTACVNWGFRTDAAIVNEPTAPPRPLTIAVTAAPWAWLVITVRGRSSEGASRSLVVRPGGLGDSVSVNAVERSMRLILAMQELERRWLVSKRHPYFPDGSFSIMPGVYQTFSSLGFGSIPDLAEIHWFCFYPPDQSESSLKSEIESVIADACRLDPWLSANPPKLEWRMAFPSMETPWEHPLPQAMASAWTSMTGNFLPTPSPLFPANFSASLDGIWLQKLGIPTIAFGPGNINFAHCVDEHVYLDEVIDSAVCLAVCAINWCGLAE